MTEMVHIMLVDDHPLVRDGLRARLEAVPHFLVVAEADSGFDALALAGSTRDFHVVGIKIAITDDADFLDGIEGLAHYLEQR